MNEIIERRLRRRAVRLHRAGHALRAIGRQLNRHPQWVAKWVQRFDQGGGPALASQSRRPRRRVKTSAWGQRQVLRLRRKLKQARIGLIGAAAIQRQWRKEQLPTPVPSLSTIKRILSAAGLTRAKPAGRLAYFPAARPTPTHPLQAMDWTERYLEGGAKVYAFHSLDLACRAARQTIRPNKNGASVRQHALEAWQHLGIPACLQLDNDAAFNGGYKVRRVIGQFVRLCLYVGVELIFLPVGEPKRNGAVESFNHLWNCAFYNRHHFETFAEVQASSPQFENWYLHDYGPPALGGLTPAQAALRAQSGRRLTDTERAAIPEALPITAGRIHFIRPVSADGTISLLNESWRTGKRLADQYVWATVNTHGRSLSLYHRRAVDKPVRLVRQYAYPLSEPVTSLLPQFQSGRRRRQVSTMS
jgi:putative transposase